MEREICTCGGVGKILRVWDIMLYGRGGKISGAKYTRCVCREETSGAWGAMALCI